MVADVARRRAVVFIEYPRRTTTLLLELVIVRLVQVPRQHSLALGSAIVSGRIIRHHLILARATLWRDRRTHRSSLVVALPDLQPAGALR